MIRAEPAFVIRCRFDSDTSLWLDLLTETQGRLSLYHRFSAQQATWARAVLQPTAQLELFLRPTASNSHKIQSLDLIAAPPALSAKALACSGYLHELLLYLLVPGQPVPAVFAQYPLSLSALSRDQFWTLRDIEWQLLHELGLMPDWQLDAQGLPLTAQACYTWVQHQGWQQAASGLTGGQLQQISNRQFQQPPVARIAQQVFQQLLSPALVGKTFHSRRLWRQLQA